MLPSKEEFVETILRMSQNRTKTINFDDLDDYSEYYAYSADFGERRQICCRELSVEKRKGDSGEMKAYKGFNKDMTCRGFQFEEGKA